MNLKRGDIVITLFCVVPENNGRILELGKFIGNIKGWAGNDRFEINTDHPLVATTGEPVFHVRGSYVRKVAGDDIGADEALSWKDVPQEVKA